MRDYADNTHHHHLSTLSLLAGLSVYALGVLIGGSLLLQWM
jgi:hypothetical protein